MRIELDSKPELPKMVTTDAPHWVEYLAVAVFCWPLTLIILGLPLIGALKIIEWVKTRSAD